MAENRFVFRKATLLAIKPPIDGRVTYYDLRCPGLSLRVTPSGRKSFSFHGRIDGRVRRVTLGEFPGTTIDQARRAVKELPVTKTRLLATKRGAARFGDVFADWLESAKGRKKTWPEDERKYRKHLAAWQHRRLGDISKQDVWRLHERIKQEHGLYQSNRVLGLLRTVLNYAIAEDHIAYEGPNPASRVAMFPEQSRQRFLQPHEISTFIRALDQEPALFHDIYWLLLLTGQRRGNVTAMRWEQIDFALKLWRIPETKNGQPHTVPLLDESIELLERRLAAQKESGVISQWVFPSETKCGHLTKLTRSWERIRQRSGLHDLRIHDLRRSLGSWETITGASLAVVGETLGHRDLKSTQVYSRLHSDPVRHAMRVAVDAMKGHDNG